MNKSDNFRISRRDLLRKSALTAGALCLPQIVPASVLGAGGAVSPNERMTIGCIGTGSRGQYLLRGFLGLKEARVVAVCDPFADRRNKAKEITDAQYGSKDCTTHVDCREILARKDVDGVIIATQDHWHALVATAAARNGKHMYCEKPLGVSVRECQAIRDAVRQHKVVFQTGTQQRSERKFRHACELVRNGYVGRIHTVQVAAEGPNYRPKYQGSLDPQPVPPGLDWETFVGPAPLKPYNPGRTAWPDWYLIWDYCAGFIVNWGVHHLDIALWGCPALLGEPFEVECRATYRNEGFTDNVNNWRATFAYPSGLKMIYSDHFQQKIGCRFIGDKGWVYVDRSGIWAEPASLLETKIRDDEIHLHKSEHHGLDFVQSVRRGSDPVSDVDAGHRASYLGMVADIAARLKRPLKWDPAKEQFIGAAGAAAMLERPMRAPWNL